MLTQETSSYFAAVGHILLNGSKESEELYREFIRCYPTPNDLKNLTLDERMTFIKKHRRAEKVFMAILLGKLVLQSKSDLRGHAYSSQLLSREMMDRLSGENQESLYLVGTDVHNEIIDIKQMFVGGLSECNVYPDQIFHRALLQSANGIAIIHNHPSGNVEPSAADMRMMERLERGSKLLGITFLDFLIVSQDNYYSFRENQAFQERRDQKK